MFIDLTNPVNIVTLCLSVIVFAAIGVGIQYIGKNKNFTIINCSLAGASVVCFLFNAVFLYVIFLVIYASFLIATLFLNLKEFKEFFGFKFFHNITFKKKTIQPEKIYDRELVFHEIEKTVQTFSKKRIGALITFERNDNLDDLTKNGTTLDAKVCFELLETIFYPGTRLHDGAVIVRSDKIIAASVYYTPTTKALTGKYGSRHRAAIGISELNDSLTVVVSEETGRISFAEGGELETVTPDKFYAKLTAKLDKLNN